MKNRLVVLFTLLALQLNAQDSTVVFGPNTFLYYLKNFHPVAKQSNLILENAKSNLLKSRGGFDPKLYSNIDEKNFDDKSYYSFLDAGLKIPTWYGIEFKTNFQQNTGVNLNPENQMPYNGLAQVGVDFSLLQGLYIDERRTALKRAKLFLKYSNFEQQALLNDLILEGMTSYWNWVAAFYQLEVQRQAVQLSFVRYQSIKSSFILGDQPAIDTLESYIQYQTRLYARIQSEQNLIEKQLLLSTYLWNDNDEPLEISSKIIAPAYNDKQNLKLVDSIINTVYVVSEQHPELKKYEFKLLDLDLERKLKAEKLKPNLDFKYNFLNEPVNSVPWDGLNSQNIKWGVTFSYPILLRRERGDLQQTKIKIKETDWLRDLKKLELQNKLNTVQSELINTQNQLQLYNSVVVNYQAMLDAELTKFINGESSVFLINSREIALIQAQLSLISLTAKYQQLYVKKRWAVGNLYE
jgi:outer membrane protein TolC